MQIDADLKKVILNSLHLDDWDITQDTFAYEVLGWDSLNHISILMDIEKRFGIHFTSGEVVALETIGDLDRLVAAKRNKG